MTGRTDRKRAVLTLLVLGVAFFALALYSSSASSNLGLSLPPAGPVVAIPDDGCFGNTHLTPALAATCEEAVAYDTPSAARAHANFVSLLAESGLGFVFASGLVAFLDWNAKARLEVPRTIRHACFLAAVAVTAILALALSIWLIIVNGNPTWVDFARSVFSGGGLFNASYRTLELFLAGFCLFLASTLDGRPVVKSVRTVIQYQAAPLLVLFTAGLMLFDTKEALLQSMTVLSWARISSVPLVTNLSVFVTGMGVMLASA